MRVVTDRYRIFCGDSKELLKKVPDNSIDAIVTDPPYGMDFQSRRSKQGPRHKKIIGDDRIDDWWIKESYRIVKEGGCIIMFCNWETSHLWRHYIENNNFIVKSQVIWNRLHHGMGDLKGSFAPMHDIIWYATKGRRMFKHGRPKSVIEAKRPSPTEDFGHPTCKPVELMEYLIHHVSSSNEKILDMFMGSGSTGIAALNNNCKFIGIEKEPKFFEIAKLRIGKAYEDESQSKSRPHAR